MAPLNFAQLPDELVISMLAEEFPARHQQLRALATLTHVSPPWVGSTNYVDTNYMANAQHAHSLMLRLVATASCMEQRPLGRVLW